MFFKTTLSLSSPAIIAMLIIGAAFAALTIFVRAPEEILLVSQDGRVEIQGLVPSSLGSFRITREERGGFPESIITPIYLIEPSQVLLPQPVHLLFRYEAAEIGAEDPSRLALARWNAGDDRWEPVESVVDREMGTVFAEVRSLGRWGVLVRSY